LAVPSRSTGPKIRAHIPSFNSTTSIHHPAGDIKKIAIDNNSPNSDNFAGTPSNSHWLVNFDEGTVEGGSSGAPLFSPNNKVIGQLHGGTNVDRCEVRDGYYGKLSLSCNKGGNNTTRLKDWLDSSDTGTITLNGIDPFLSVNVPQPAPEVDEYDPITFSASVNSNVDRSPYTYSWDLRQCQSCAWQSVCSGGSSCTTSFSDNTDGDALASVRVYVYDDEGETHTDKTDIVVNEQDGSGGDECQYGNQNPNYICPKSTTPRQGTPDTFALQSSSPNPVAQQASIRFALPEKQHVRLVVYDLMGRTVAKLVNETKSAGYHRVSFTPKGLGSGVYVYRITAGPHRATRRMTVVQ
uniref:T9SS type A sorting domain-containing protein n=1 Tax=Salinibacter altiplanensis TaxID=1803181 RepID=UPI001E6328C8